MTMDASAADLEEIGDVIAEECTAFYCRDFKRWASFWVKHEGTHRLGTLAGGHVDYKQGWSVHGPVMKRIMQDFPNPNPVAAAAVRRDNMIIRLHGDMAWVSFDQYTPRTEDPFVNVGLSYQVRIMERHEGHWLIAFAAHGDTQIEYNAFPSIRVKPDGEILWMNPAARAGLRDHPVLTESAGTLRARKQDHDALLRQTLREVGELSPIDIRSSLCEDAGNRAAIPLVLEDAFEDAIHILWVSWLDGMIVVSFDDTEAIAHRLERAQAIYGLSDTQVKLAELVVDGMDLGQAAEKLGVSLNTARTHLRRVFEKTKVHSQTALVRVILNSSSPASWS